MILAISIRFHMTRIMKVIIIVVREVPSEISHLNHEYMIPMMNRNMNEFGHKRRISYDASIRSTMIHIFIKLHDNAQISANIKSQTAEITTSESGTHHG